MNQPPEEPPQSLWCDEIGSFVSSRISGKWLIDTPPEVVDVKWAKLVALVEADRVPGAKRSTATLAALRQGQHLLLAYCYASDRDSAGAALRVLRDAGFAGRLQYKRDIDTIMGVDRYEWTSDDFERTDDAAPG